MSGSSEDNLEFNCPQCKTQLSVPPSKVGQRIQCPRCQTAIVVPGMQPAESDMFGNLFDDDAEPVSEPQKTEKENKSTQPPNPETIELTVDSGREVDPLPDDLKIDDEFLSFGDDGKSEPAQPESTNPDSLDPLDRVEKQMDGAGRLTPESIPESIPDALEEILSLDNEPHPLNDDLLAGLDVPSGPAGPLDPPAPDPFQANDDEPIRIDGVDGAYGSEVISILCPVCESRVYGKRREKSYQIKCEDCFSMVDIPSSEEWDEKNQGSGDQRKQAGSDMQFSVDEPELKLEAPVVKPTIDYNTDDDMGLEPIDNDLLAPEVHPIETELFHRQDPHPGTPDSSQSSASETTQPVTDSTEEDLLLQPVDEDLGPLISTHTELDQPQLAELVPDDDQLELISDEHAVGPTSHTSTPDGQATQLEAENDDDQLELLPLEDLGEPANDPIPEPVPAVPAYPHAEPTTPRVSSLKQPSTPAPGPEATTGSRQSSTAKPVSDPVPDGGEGNDKGDKPTQPIGDMLLDWLKAPLLLFKTPEALAQIGFYFLLQAVALVLVGIGASYLQAGESSDTHTLSEMVAYFPYYFGKFVGIVAWLYQGVILYNCILLGLYQDEESAEWPELNVEEIFSQFWRVGLANIVAGIPLTVLLMILSPLGIAGAIAAVVLGTLTLFALGPPMMMSALYNQEFYKIVSPKIFQSFSVAPKPWLVFSGFLTVLWIAYMSSYLMVIMNSCFVNGIVALVWTVVLPLLGGFTGYQFRQIMLATGDVSRITPTDKEKLTM